MREIVAAVFIGVLSSVSINAVNNRGNEEKIISIKEDIEEIKDSLKISQENKMVLNTRTFWMNSVDKKLSYFDQRDKELNERLVRIENKIDKIKVEM